LGKKQVISESTNNIIDIEAVINKAVENAVAKAIEVGRTQVAKSPEDIYKTTERRLYALPDLKDKVTRDKEYVRTILTEGLPKRSKDIARFQRSGCRLEPEELLEALAQDLRASIAADEFEIKTLDEALAPLTSDPYYLSVSGRYFESKSDEDIAESLDCETRTVRRNRGRLVRRIAVRLYGTNAV